MAEMNETLEAAKALAAKSRELAEQASALAAQAAESRRDRCRVVGKIVVYGDAAGRSADLKTPLDIPEARQRRQQRVRRGEQISAGRTGGGKGGDAHAHRDVR